ncbi:MAG: hypothetical protein RR232_01680 [Clostridia bacterium]
MNKYGDKRLITVSAIAVLCISVCILAVALLSNKSYGYIKLCAVDAYTLAPIEGVTIVIPEYDLSITTNDAGIADATRLELRVDKEHELLLSQFWGEITVLAYKDGYLPYALFYVHVFKQHMRSGPTLYMFPEGENSGVTCISVIESPEKEWTQQLLERYAPYNDKS